MGPAWGSGGAGMVRTETAWSQRVAPAPAGRQGGVEGIGEDDGDSMTGRGAAGWLRFMQNPHPGDLEAPSPDA